MAGTTPYRMKTITFPEANTTDERMAAVLVTKAEDGTLKAYVKDFPDRHQPDPEIVALLVQATEIANL